MRLVLDRSDLRALREAIVDHRRFGEPGEFVAHRIIDAVMDIGALDREAHLTAIEEGGVEDALRGGAHIDIVEHDPGSFPPSSSVSRLSPSAALAMIFLPVAVDPVKPTLAIRGSAVR